MKQNYALFLFILILFNSCQAQNLEQKVGASKTKNTIVFLDPEIEPDVDEIKQATNDAFFNSVSDYFSTLSNVKLLRVQIPISYNDVSQTVVSESCINNDAQFAVVPKIKFFKVGFGKYILSSQVIVSMKLYDAAGNFISENSYDTFRKRGRVLGSAENSVRSGTKGALRLTIKEWRKNKR